MVTYLAQQGGQALKQHPFSSCLDEASTVNISRLDVLGHRCECMADGLHAAWLALQLLHHMLGLLHLPCGLGLACIGNRPSDLYVYSLKASFADNSESPFTDISRLLDGLSS